MSTELLESISIRLLRQDEAIPYELLLDADPNIEAIAKYLGHSQVYVALIDDAVIAVLVLYPTDATTIEIKNIAVAESLQGKGIGKLLLQKANQIAKDKDMKRIQIGTANSSIGQLYLYQQAGFELSSIKYNFFIDNYPEPLFENGIQCRHMLMLVRDL